MAELAEIFRGYGNAYLDQFNSGILPSHRRAIQDILDCRTASLGGHLFQCDGCGNKQYSYHSCRNRSCPKCHRNETDTWIQQRGNELLPVPYYHLVFTVPQELRHTIRSHQKVLYGLLMKAAAQALIKLAADPHYVGGRVGVLAVLHTWTGALVYHPHVHCLVPAGGISKEPSTWIHARQSYLIPVKALSIIFRGMFRDLLRKAFPQLELPESIWRISWVVHCKPAIQGTGAVLKYLARYVHRIAITNHRILSIDNGCVTFRYKDSRQPVWKTMTISAEEFIRRFLQHVLPRGFHKVRYYGLWSPVFRPVLRQIQLLLSSDNFLETTSPAKTPDPPRHPLIGKKCPHCGKGRLVLIAQFFNSWREPP